MKTVLLAINGEHPSHAAFDYAVGLCRRMRAELNILQFIKTRKIARCLSSTRKKVSHLNRMLENSFAGAAFAEEGMPDVTAQFMHGMSKPLKNLLEENPTDVHCNVELSSGDPEIELSEFIEERHDIVLTIFDPAQDGKIDSNSTDLKNTDLKKTGPKKRAAKSSRSLVKSLKKKIHIPLVVVEA